MMRINRPVATLLFMLLALLSVQAPALAQESEAIELIDARVSRIERVLDQSLLKQFQRVDSLQQEIRSLRGEIESLTYELNNLRKRNDDLYGNADGRISSLEQAQGSLNLFNDDGTLIEGALLDETAIALDETQFDPGTQVTESSDGEPAAVIVREGGPVIPTADAEEFGGGPLPPQGRLRDTATSAEKLAYNTAYDQLARGRAEEALQSFDSFLSEYPDGPYSDNAWYWQGEALYSQRDFETAIRNFGVVVNSFPQSPKVPDARLKIGFALYEQQQFDQARAILTGVQDDYPGRSASVLARRRLQQMSREGV